MKIAFFGAGLLAAVVTAVTSTALVKGDTILAGDHVLVHAGSQDVDLRDCVTVLFSICPPAPSTSSATQDLP